MLLKTIIVVLFVALLISLATGFVFLIKDKGTAMRTWNSLSVRLIIAFALIACLIYGFATGQLKSKAPWDAMRAPQTQTAE